MTDSQEVEALPLRRSIAQHRGNPRHVILRHLPVDFIETLDEMYGRLLVENGGFATWTQRIQRGELTEISETRTLRKGHNF